MRLVVDCQEGDNSSVFAREMLDQPYCNGFKKPWLFDCDEFGVTEFDTEEDACKAQREYRVMKGFDPLTGK